MEAAAEAMPVRWIETKYGRLKAYRGDQDLASNKNIEGSLHMEAKH